MGVRELETKLLCHGLNATRSLHSGTQNEGILYLGPLQYPGRGKREKLQKDLMVPKASTPQ